MDIVTPPGNTDSTHQNDPPKILDATLEVSESALRSVPTVLCAPFAAIDCETTGTDASKHEAVSVAVVLADRNLLEVAHFYQLITPQRLHFASLESLVICGYSAEAWEAGGAVTPEVAAKALASWLRGRRPIAHHLDFDKRFFAGVLRAAKQNPPWSSFGFCTLDAARKARSTGKLASRSAKLVDVAEFLKLPFERQEGAPHSALDDARACLAVARSFRAKGWMKI